MSVPTAVRLPSWTVARLLPLVSAPLSGATTAAVVAAGLLPIAFTLATGLVVSRVPAAVASGGLMTPDGRRLLAALATLAAIFVVQQVSNPFRQLLVFTLARRTSLHLRSRVMGASLAPHGIRHLEDPEMLDRLSLARGVGAGEVSPGDAVRGLYGVAFEYVQWAGAAIIVGRTWWWLAVMLVAAHIVARMLLRRELLRTFELMVGETRAMRRSRYFRDLILTPGAAKEARVFGMRAWILERFGAHWLMGMREVWSRRAKSWRTMGFILALLCGTYVLALMMIARSAGTTLSPAAVTVLVSSVLAFATFNMDSDLLLTHGAAAIPPALNLEKELGERATASEGGSVADGMPARAIRFEGVRFRYPGTDALIVDGLDLEIPAGRSLAIVGPNGAGKTTLVKLLAAMYEPEDGRITVDDVDVRALDPVSWQRRIGAIFQDFVQYQLPAADNVGFGAVERRGDLAALQEAADLAGARAIVEGLPNGWDTPLSRQYAGGADLSGGEWQRVALARAMFAVRAGAGVLVLDEPTANLDVRAEVELFDRFLELTRGLTTILISHRFSTVRRADRIVVLEQGRVSEQGTHDELLARGGTYAHMFNLQAARFVENEPRETVETT